MRCDYSDNRRVMSYPAVVEIEHGHAITEIADYGHTRSPSPWVLVSVGVECGFLDGGQHALEVFPQHCVDHGAGQ